MTMTGQDASALLDAFFAAIEAGDIDAVGRMCADDVAVWHNVTGTTLDKPASLDLLRFWSRSVSSMRYEITERKVFDGGVVQRHVLHGTANANGTVLAASICIVFHFRDGLITEIFEYLDPAAVSAVFDR
jgi:ketosteroid isomerase-like protein